MPFGCWRSQPPLALRAYTSGHNTGSSRHRAWVGRYIYGQILGRQRCSCARGVRFVNDSAAANVKPRVRHSANLTGDEKKLEAVGGWDDRVVGEHMFNFDIEPVDTREPCIVVQRDSHPIYVYRNC